MRKNVLASALVFGLVASPMAVTSASAQQGCRSDVGGSCGYQDTHPPVAWHRQNQYYNYGSQYGGGNGYQRGGGDYQRGGNDYEAGGAFYRGRAQSQSSGQRVQAYQRERLTVTPVYLYTNEIHRRCVGDRCSIYTVKVQRR